MVWHDATLHYSLSHFISIVSFKICLQFCQDIFPVGELVQGVTVRLDLAHQDSKVRLARGLDHLLDNIVPVLVLDHRPQRGLVRADL